MRVAHLVAVAVACSHSLHAASWKPEPGGFLALFKRLWDFLTNGGIKSPSTSALRRPPIRKRPAHQRKHSAHTYEASATFSDDPLPPIQPIHRGVPRRSIDTPKALREHADSIQAFRAYLEANGRLEELKKFDRRQAEADEAVKEDVTRAERYMDSVEQRLKPFESPEFINRAQSDGESNKGTNTH